MFGTSAVFYRKPNRFRIDHRDGKPLPSGNSKFRLIRSKSTVSTNRSSPSKQVAQVPITPVKNIPYAWVSRQYAADRISAKNDQNESVKLTGKRHSSTRRYKLVRSANISVTPNTSKTLATPVRFFVSKSGMKLHRMSKDGVNRGYSYPATIFNRSFSMRQKKGTMGSASRFNLVRKRRKESLCVYFHRYGRCVRGDNCPYIHNPEKVAVCSRFLRGKCSDLKCPFSHKLNKSKMPVCSFFLKGVCTKDDCPYLHVKHQQSAALCKDFAKGFCAKGEKCDNIHLRYQHRRLSIKKSLRKKMTSKKTATTMSPSSIECETFNGGPLPEFIRLSSTPSGKDHSAERKGEEKKELLELAGLVPSFLSL